MQYLPGANNFLMGCNYWSSEAGISMWHKWSEEAVEKDFAALKESGVNCVRLFPLWSDFQPVMPACGCNGKHVEFVMPDGSPLPVKRTGMPWERRPGSNNSAPLFSCSNFQYSSRQKSTDAFPAGNNILYIKYSVDPAFQQLPGSSDCACKATAE